ncbi:hypothetical protein QBC40DRAFT_281215 [Triangularia verruculosa]|uniref:gamma-glutamylcyclotransferase n=1 Tax=Triangularia verruculosa TaxID=2587418 RepID=A0AAN7AWC0_9PEZI|nr:hypothetical protein QBC40DRAFT_281215 [Triangularia verruculosa]
MGTSDSPPHSIYFGYGSNLWLDQMSRRCPSTPYLGLGRLKDYHWFINERGYANIAHSTTYLDQDETDEVWGLIYSLTPEDEAMLDINEGVPYAYEKEVIPVEFWEKGTPDVGKGAGRNVDMLVYIDHKRSEGGYKPREEYIVRMNKGIDDALKEGVPMEYVERVLRPYIPAEEQGVEVEKLAQRQAGGFEDESGVIPARVTAEAVGSGVDLVGGGGGAGAGAGGGGGVKNLTKIWEGRE